MRSNYKKLGKYIKQVNNRNKDLTISNLLGINIDKFFMPSVANIIGTDLSVYKIVKKGQFACNRMHVGRDMRLPVALSKNDEDFIVSPAYDVFEIIDENELLSEYLMMWFSRKEFDRNAWFYTDADVRQGLHWDAFINIELPVPDIKKQKEIVDEYNVIKNRISLNNDLITKLEETAQAIYREWFVDNVDLENLPDGWKISSLSKIANYLNGLAMQKFEPKENQDFISVIKIRELNLGKTDENSGKAKTNIPKEYMIENGDIIFSWSGSLVIDIWAGGKGGLNQHLFKVYSEKYPKWFIYWWTKYHLDEFIKIAEGNKTSMGHIKREHLDNAKVLIPCEKDFLEQNSIMTPILEKIILKKIEISKLEEMKDLILSKMASGC